MDATMLGGRKEVKILLTGGFGFLGQYVYKKLEEEKLGEIICPLRRGVNGDLRKQSTCQNAVKGIDTVIHLAANCGGIGYNQEHPGELFYDNAIMGIQLMEEARKAGVKKFVQVGTICAYPKNTKVPFREYDLWNGYPEETNAPYGLAKKMLLVQAQAYRKQYGFNAIYLLPVNLYGPGDNFDPDSSHVIPALIKKFVEAKNKGKKSVEIWGTGNATREFLYVEDCAEAIVKAMKNYDKGEPINIGAGFEISIQELVRKIIDLVGYTGNLTWNISKPDGQPRRRLDTLRAETEFGFKSKTSLDEGLKKTIEFYLQQ